MQKFEQQLQKRAHISKIRNAKKTLPFQSKLPIKQSPSQAQQTQILTLYEKKKYYLIPVYKFLKTAGLQHYSKGFIERGFGIKIGGLAKLQDKDRYKLYQDLKVLPGHAVKLDRLIQTINKCTELHNKQLCPATRQAIQQQQNPSHPPSNKLQLDKLMKTHDKLFIKYIQNIGQCKSNKKNYQNRYSTHGEVNKIYQYGTCQPSANNDKECNNNNIFAECVGSAVLSHRNYKNSERLMSQNQIKSKIHDKQSEHQKLSEINVDNSKIQKKKKSTNQKPIYQKKTPTTISTQPQKYPKIKEFPLKPQQTQSKKKNYILQNKALSTKKPSIDKVKSKSITTTNTTSKLKNINLGLDQLPQLSTTKLMQLTLQLDKIKTLYRSFDGSLMSSTIANIDIQQLVYAFAGYVSSIVIASPQPQDLNEKQYHIDQGQPHYNQLNLDDQVGNILKESYLHPLYRDQITPDSQNLIEDQTQQILEDQELVNSQGEIQQQQQEHQQPQNQFMNVSGKEKNVQQSAVSSFLGGQSYHFGLDDPLHIFNQPQPTQLDYLKPTIDSIANFIKNIVLTAKMQREIPIMSAYYLQMFIKNTGIILTSINYRRLLVTVLLLASKIWDDESFESPSFSKTFPEYNTILLNEMQKEILKALDYKLKLQKKQYTEIYFLLRKFVKKNLRSYQNKKIQLKKIRELQNQIKIQYKQQFMEKRCSF